MRALVHITHPAHVHFFKRFIWEAKKKGPPVKVLTTNQDISLDLLDEYDIDYKLCPYRCRMTPGT